MLVDKLRVPVAPQEHAEVIEPGHDALQLHSVHQEDRERCLVLADMVEEGVLEVLCAFGRHCHCSIFWLTGPFPRALLPSRCAHFLGCIHDRTRTALLQGTSAGCASTSWGQRCSVEGKSVGQLRSAWLWNSARSAVATDPGAPFPTGRSSIRTTGMTIWLAEVRKASRAPCASSTVNGRSSNCRPWASMTPISTVLVIPLKIALSAGRVTTLPPLVTIQALLDDPSVTWPSWSTNQASLAPRSRAACLASTLGSSEIDLMSTRCHRLSGTVMIAKPSAAVRSLPAKSMLRAVTTTLG